MSEIGQWRPVQEAHAIQMAAVGLKFAEPITGKILEFVDRAVEPVASKLGLSTKNSINEMGFFVGFGAPPALPTSGVEFIRFERPDFFTDKCIIEKNAFRYEDWSYTRWAVLSEKIDRLWRDVISKYTEATYIEEVYVEYIDVFVAPITSDDSTDLVIRANSNLIAAVAPSGTGLWHSHCGYFEPAVGDVRRLHQVNVDVGEGTTPDGDARLIQVRTYVADKVKNTDGKAGPSLTKSWDLISEKFHQLHDCAKNDFRAVVTPQAAQAVSLG